jgi:hypothetical protein
MELYNEELTDLLCIDSGGDKDKRLRLLEDRGGVVVQGLEEMVVKSAAGAWRAVGTHVVCGLSGRAGAAAGVRPRTATSL